MILPSRQEVWQTAPASSGPTVCSSNQSSTSSLASRLVRSRHCREHQSRHQPPSTFGTNHDASPTAAGEVAALDNAHDRPPLSHTKHSASHMANPIRPSWWSSGHWSNNKAASVNSVGRQVKALQPHSTTSSPSVAACSTDPTFLMVFNSTYLFSTVAPHRLRLQLPQPRILLILTEPVTHAITQFNRLWVEQQQQQHAAQKNLSVPVLALLDEQQQNWMEGLNRNMSQQMQQYAACQAGRRFESDKTAEAPCSRSLALHVTRQHQHNWQVVKQAVYADSLAHWLQVFPADQVLIWTSEGFAAEPQQHIQQLAVWLGLNSSSIEPAVLAQRQAQLQLELDVLMIVMAQPPWHLLDSMQQFYQVHNERLFQLLQDRGFTLAAAQMRRLWVPRQQWSILSSSHASQKSTSANSTLVPGPQQSEFQVVTDVSLDQLLLQVPQSFMGISHEWRHVESINNIPGYKDMLRLLSSYGSGPFIIRVGGGSTDRQDTVPSAAVFDALRQVHEETGVKYILGLNFQKGDVELARAQWEAAKQHLPAEALLTFEIGNEVSNAHIASTGRLFMQKWSLLHTNSTMRQQHRLAFSNANA